MKSKELLKRLDYGKRDAGSDQKLAEMILYVSERLQDRPTFGSTVLNKIIYLADREAYRRLGRSITGAEYMSLPQGPVPKHLVPVRQALEHKGEFHLLPRPVGSKEQKRPVATRRADVRVFEQRELALLDAIIDFFGGFNATRLSKFTHDRVWRIAGTEKERIPYQAAAFISNEPITEYDIQRTGELAQRHGWPSV